MFCPQCGAPNEDDAIFCGNCGAVLDADEVAAPAESEAPEALDEELETGIIEEIDSVPVPLSDELPDVPPPPPPQPPPRHAPSPTVQTSGLAIASLVSGIAGWTVLPLLGSILAIVFGLITIIWSVAFVQRKHGGLILILLSIGQLLFGGGLFPPLIGAIAGMVGTRINEPLTWSRAHLGGGFSRWLAKLYPWALIAYLVLVFGQFITGYFFNEFLMTYMGINVLFIMGFLLLAVFSSFAHDAQEKL